MRPFERHKKRETLGMSIYAETLLDMIDREDGMTVMEVLEDGMAHKVGSYATLHKAVKWLEDAEFIKMKVSEGDGRMRICTTSQRGTIYLNTFK